MNLFSVIASIISAIFGGGGGGGGGGGVTSVPEIDGGSGIAALAVVISVALIFRAKYYYK